MNNNNEQQSAIKDANDVLQVWTAADIEPAEQRERIGQILQAAPTTVEEVCRWAGALKGAERDRGLETAFRMIGGMERLQIAQYRSKLCELMGIGIREFNDMSKAVGKAGEEAAKEVEYILGGWIPDKNSGASSLSANSERSALSRPRGWLVEYLYDPETDKAAFAYRDPEGKIGKAETLEIDGVRYAPKPPDEIVRKGAVIFPSDIGKPKENLELVAIIESFIHRNYLLDNKMLGRLMAYWVMMTWIYDGLEALPYLRAMGDAGSGKSELMKRVGYLCYRLLITGGASSDSSFFRMTEMYRGTVFMDEMDLPDGGDMDNPKVKFLNLGAMRGNPIIRMEEGYNEVGNRVFLPVLNTTFCPKLICMRKDFMDEAVGTRSITIQTFEKFPEELAAAGVSLQLTEDFYIQARAIRNLLLYWRLVNWQERIQVDASLIDMHISSRLNQVTIGLKAIAKNDMEMLGDIQQFLRVYYQELMLSKNMSKTARVIEAMWKIHSYPDLRAQMVMKNGDEREYMLVGHVTKIANEIMDVMNSLAEADESDEEGSEGQGGKGKRPRRKTVSPRSVGEIIRRELQLQMGQRRGDGYPVYWDEVRMGALAKRYGVDVESLPKIKREVATEGSGERHEQTELIL